MGQIKNLDNTLKEYADKFEAALSQKEEHIIQAQPSSISETKKKIEDAEKDKDKGMATPISKEEKKEMTERSKKEMPSAQKMEKSPGVDSKEQQTNKSNIKEQMQTIREKLQAKYSKEEIHAQIKSSEKVDMLKQVGTIKKSAKGQIFFAQGDEGDCMYLILRGMVDIYIRKSGKNQKVARLAEKDFFGEMSLLEKVPRPITAVSYTDALVLEIKEENFMKFIQYDPEITFNLIATLSRRVVKLDEKLKEARK